MCRYFELLGMFVAKCIQDDRRVDLPLSRPFFKLMCSYTREATSEDSSGQPGTRGTTPSPQHDTCNRSTEYGHYQHPQNRRPVVPVPQSTGEIVDGADLKEAELLLVAGVEEILKDGSGKEEVVLEELSVGDCQSEVAWFDGILDFEDLATVNPFRAKFMKQVGWMFTQVKGHRTLTSTHTNNTMYYHTYYTH